MCNDGLSRKMLTRGCYTQCRKREQMAGVKLNDGRSLAFGGHYIDGKTWVGDFEGLEFELTKEGVEISAGNRWESSGRRLDKEEVKELIHFLQEAVERL